MRKLVVVWDVETYPNYVLLDFKRVSDGKRKSVMFNDTATGKDLAILLHIFRTCTLVGYNSRNFDSTIAGAVMDGWDAKGICALADWMISNSIPGWIARDMCGLVDPTHDHIDLQPVNPKAAQKPSLKLMGSCLHADKLQDLPILPGTWLSEKQKQQISDYCENDLDTTALLYKSLLPRIKLREQIGKDWGLELRSKSDAQMAEAYMRKTFRDKLKKKNPPPPGTIIRYKPPKYLRFKTLQLQRVFSIVKNRRFRISENQTLGFPRRFERLTKTTIGNTTYKVGIGGLHSQEKSTMHKACSKYAIIDYDFSSYYPKLIVTNKWYPKHIGRKFYNVLDEIVESRLLAKKEGRKVEADGKKIIVNGTFGQTNNFHSSIYDPSLMLHTTLTGQLVLLMMIESIELAGFGVISANTDGIVTKVDRNREPEFHEIIKSFSKKVSIGVEETRYKALYSRDVNNYLGVTEEGELKKKGIFVESGPNKFLSPDVVTDAAIAYLVDDLAIETTVHNCSNPLRFLAARRVTGGAVWRGEYLGKVVRWCYTTDGEPICYGPGKKEGHKVGKTEGSTPVMDLVDMPQNIDFASYVQEARELVKSVGVTIGDTTNVAT